MLNKSALKVITELYPKHGAELWRHVEYKNDGAWCPCVVANDFSVTDADEYRVKPATHIINGIECPAPLSVEPEMDAEYWYVTTIHSATIGEFSWGGDIQDLHIFKIGNCFATKEDALANFYAHYPHMRGEV